MQNQYGRPAQDKGADTTTDQRDRPDGAPISVIGADIVITGNIEASVDLHIEGKVIGDVRCATLILGEESAIEGRVHAERVRVSGSVQGSIDTRDLAIEATARVSGEISYERLRVANGGSLEGNVKRKAATEEPEAGKLKLVESKTDAKPAAVFIE